MKVCKECKRELELKDFYKNPHCTSGYLNQCKECTKQRLKTDRLNNIEIYKQRRKKVYQKNREENILKSVEWGRKNKDKRDVAKKKWNLKNKERISHLAKGYYARKKGAIGEHTLLEWKRLCDLFGNKCLACGATTKLTRDHIIPLSKGGTNYIENIQPLCVSCNSKKGNRIIINYKI